MTISTASSRYSWVNLRYFGIMTLPPREKFSLLGSLSGGSNTPQALRSAPISTNNVGGGDSVSGRFLRSQNGLAVRSSGPGSRLGAGPGGLPVIPTPRQGAA